VRRIPLLVSLLLMLQAVDARALTLLTESKVGAFRHDPATGGGSAQISVGRDRALAQLEDPTVCPASASIRIASYPTATNLVTGGPEVALPCERWSRIPGGFLYRDPSGAAGGVRTVRYTTRGLSVDARAPGFEPVVGPVGYVQMWLTVGDTRYLVRLHDFVVNGAETVISRRASHDGAAGEAAFWDTLWGDAERTEDALRYLERAVARNRRDARSHFLLGMQYLNLYGQETRDLNHPSEGAKSLVLKSRAAFDRAVPLLWDGRNGDSRVPGFAAAATYAKGVGFADPALTARGIEELEYATSINTLFNSFDLLAVAPAISNKDPLYARVIDLLDVTFPEVAGYCGTQQEICFNDGMAPHNLEGTFILFGDIYAKGGRTDDARDYYGSALGIGSNSGWDARFVAAVQDRLDHLEERVALYQDDDPSNDPPFVGAGGAGACAYCHRK
jgi:tetratricopeptide (TPR) repeat protein